MGALKATWHLSHTFLHAAAREERDAERARARDRPAGAGPPPEESTVLYGLSYNSPYKPPHNKRILDEEEERNVQCSSAALYKLHCVS